MKRGRIGALAAAVLLAAALLALSAQPASALEWMVRYIDQEWQGAKLNLKQGYDALTHKINQREHRAVARVNQTITELQEKYKGRGDVLRRRVAMLEQEKAYLAAFWNKYRQRAKQNYYNERKRVDSFYRTWRKEWSPGGAKDLAWRQDTKRSSTKTIDWCIKCKQSTPASFRVQVPSWAKTATLGIAHGYDDTGDRCVDFTASCGQGAIRRKHCSTGWEHYKLQCRGGGVFTLNLQDGDTKPGGEHPGNGGEWKVSFSN
ncbi:MAG: hypothetical protein KQH53_03525 [Desulfarculaceae bacterium]|nr:hypothetical protein [Desulfarculaceae bacterium]